MLIAKNKKHFPLTIRSIAFWTMLITAPLNVVHAEDTGASAAEQEQIQRIKQAVIEELRQSDFLKKEIQAGIQAYVNEQRAAQVAAAAEKERKLNERAQAVRRIDEKRDHVYGDLKARLSIIEYSDFECPYCKRFHQTPKQVVDMYEGRVNWVYRHFPLEFHTRAKTHAEASECASELGGNNTFWKFTDAVYSRSGTKGAGFPVEDLVPLAVEIGLNPDAFRDCLDSGKYASRVREDLEEGGRIGITGTPGSILLNNETGKAMLVSGALPLEQFKQKLEQVLE